MKKIKDLKFLFLDILADDPKLKRDINRAVYGTGGYSESTRKMFGLEKSQWKYLDAGKGKLPKTVGKFDAVIIGGSTADAIDGKESKWMRDAYAYIKKIIDKQIPILGFCGGLQFTARALGKKVIMNPKGREMDLISLEITGAGLTDPLFKDLPNNILVCASHKCMIEGLGEDWKLLASSKMCEYHAVAIGDKIRLTQFHPEMRAGELKALAKLRKNPLIKEGFFEDEEAFDRFIASINDKQKAGKQIIKNFIKYFVLPNEK